MATQYNLNPLSKDYLKKGSTNTSSNPISGLQTIQQASSPTIKPSSNNLFSGGNTGGTGYTGGTVSSVSSPMVSSGVDYGALYNSYYDPFASEINKSIDELIAQANGDYDFAAKWIEAQYKQALGTDDAQRQEFLKKVANGLEEKVGRIAFDYETGTYRLNEDVGIAKNRELQSKDLALKRLAEDEQVLRKEADIENQIAREEQGTSLNSRGILSSTRENADGLAGKEVGRLEEDINGRMSALERAALRSKDDINIGSNMRLEDLAIAQSRGLEDLATTARRGAGDEQTNRNQGIEQAQRLRDRAKLLAEHDRRTSLNSLASYADSYAKKAGGIA